MADDVDPLAGQFVGNGLDTGSADADAGADGVGPWIIGLDRDLGTQTRVAGSALDFDQALAEIRAQTGLDQFELIGMDACLMGHVEVFCALAPHARYAMASQETEPALGWAYTQFLAELTADPDMSGAELSRSIVDSYIEDDQRIRDDQARAEATPAGA